LYEAPTVAGHDDVIGLLFSDWLPIVTDKVSGRGWRWTDLARALDGVGEDMKNLYHEVFTLLLSKIQSSATNSAKMQSK